MYIHRLVLAVASVFTFFSAQAADPLPSLRGDPAQVSISGLSSGAFMAVQYQVAFSSSVVGAGIVAGGPYYCAAGMMVNTSICMGQVPFIPPNPVLMLSAAQKFADQNEIDPVSSLKNDRIYIFSGTKDTVVYQQAVNATAGFFKQAGVPDSNLKYVNNVAAGHALITTAFGNACPVNAAPYISQCTVKGRGYDQAGEILQHIYGKLKPEATKLSGKIISFNQREFASSETGMAAEAFAYVPKACSNGASCKVHVALHGCMQSASKVGNDFYSDTGYNSWADTNQIVVLYPQVDASDVPFNPNGCWDWWGYTGQNYAFKSGIQVLAIKAMVDRLTGQK